MFRLVDVTLGHPMQTLAMHLLADCGVLAQLALSPARVASFFDSVARGYRANPFHNAIHATDVCQSMFCMLNDPALVASGALAAPQELLAAVMAACMHDLDHPGVTNGFLVATQHPLALRYNDQNVLENYHVAAGFAQLLRPCNNFLEGSALTLEQKKVLRTTIIKMVLSTDMATHMAQGQLLSACMHARVHAHVHECMRVCMRMCMRMHVPASVGGRGGEFDA